MASYLFHLLTGAGGDGEREVVQAQNDDQARIFAELILLCSEDADTVEVWRHGRLRFRLDRTTAAT